MKAFEVQPGGGPDVLRLAERPSPPMRPHEVRVRIRAVSLNYRDLLVVQTAKSRSGPVVPCSDGVGEVMEVGADVRALRVGDRVAAAMLPTWLDGAMSEADQAAALGGPVDGVLAEEVVLPEGAWVPIPARLSWEQAATLPCAAVTAWNALFVAGGLKPGDNVLVQGSGGVAVFSLQLAVASGATVIATSSSAEKMARLEKLGASATINYVDDAAWGKAVRAVTGGQGVDIVVESGGAGTFDQSVKALRTGGTVSLLGVLTGGSGNVDLYAAVRKAVRVHGIFVGSVRMFADVVRAIDKAGIAPVIDRVFDFHDTPEAYAHLEGGRHFGKVVITVP